jgi:phospholipid/cholesterol/gamma-HCH transport system substrate-binding protein
MKNSAIEVFTGALVLVIALVFLLYGYTFLNKNNSLGSYNVFAKFDRVDGLIEGNDVKLGGVKIGKIKTMSVDPKSYQIVVSIDVNENIALPTDTSAEINSDGFLGGKYLSLVPGGASDYLKSGMQINYTQSSVSIEQLIGKYMFSNNQNNKN